MVKQKKTVLAAATDALVNASVATRTEKRGYTIVRTPQRPDYWFGNCLVLGALAEPENYSAWSQLHARIFEATPVKRHVVVWEVRGPRGETRGNESAPTPERRTVFAIKSLLRRQANFAQIRPLSTAADWDAATEMEERELMLDSWENADFARWRFGVLRNDAGAGRCRLWGAWCDGSLVAYAGLYANEEYGRFTTPVTLPEYRRRGLFGALCSVALRETLQTFPRATIVIVAEAASEPEAIYKHLGFDVVGEQYALITPVG